MSTEFDEHAPQGYEDGGLGPADHSDGEARPEDTLTRDGLGPAPAEAQPDDEDQPGRHKAGTGEGADPAGPNQGGAERAAEGD